MRNITIKLNCRAELWGMVKFQNELREWDIKEGKIKDIYCNILPANPSSQSQKWSTTIVEVLEHSHKFTVRSKSIIDIKRDMFFIFKGLKYEVNSWNPDFKNNEFIEIFTNLVLE